MAEIKGHIVAMGGGGFSMEPDNPLLDDFILSLAPRSPARVCFIPTASADSAQYLVKFYRAFSGRAIATDLTLFDPPSVPRQPASTSEIASFVAEQDILYVGGGNTANLLAMWRVHGLDQVLYEAWREGKVLCGISAGMICWFRDGLTDSFGALASLGDGLGFIDASACPHYDSEPDRPTAFHNAIAAGLPGGYAADDSAALHFCGQDLVEAVTSRAGASAYRVDLVDGQVQETKLATRFLGMG
ncbi:MAG: Type 1 glutamine amidotransferase-like domain-containing protein [Leptolyngbyaceae cyanobacterium]